jgi:flagellar hook-associated protein 1 FlgK
MPDVMSSGLSALLAFQRALETTSHNIANANTPGFVRQRAEFVTRQPQINGSGWVGNGVDVATVTRQYDQFLVSQTRTASSAASGFDAYASLAARVNNLFSDSGTGIGASLQKLNAALQGVATEPTSIAARQVLLGEARSTVDRLQFFDDQLRVLEAETNDRVGIEIREVNSLAASIARLNGEIASGYAKTGQPPNDLLDERDRLIDRLSERLNVSVVAQGEGSVNVFVGSGQALVLNTAAARLETTPDNFDPTRSRVTLRGFQGSTDITSALSGGTLGGLLDSRTEVLDPARNALGRIAVGLTEQLNGQHRAGQDLTGALGVDLFSVGAPTVNASAANAGTASVTAGRDGAAGLTGADYELAFNGAAWSLRRLDTNATVPMTGTGTLADPFRADGVTLTVGGTPANSDRFLVRPSREAVQGLDLRITDPSRIAAATPIRTVTAAANTGGAMITSGEVIDPANTQLRSAVTIRFTSPTTYSVNGAGSFAYTSGAPIDLNGWRVEISGAPAIGDEFQVLDNASGRGDNRNALALAARLREPMFDGGATSVSDAATTMTSDIGTLTQQAQINRDAQSVILQESVQQRSNANGVNLDEEAANLLRFQQAYQAAAQLVRIAGEMFDALLAASR